MYNVTNDLTTLVETGGNINHKNVDKVMTMLLTL